jgi:transcription initiation factor TFIIIB Brf1 subunit/transcription initiation factor TFIIB
MEIITCPECKSEIAVNDINNYDVDCDCGAIIKRDLKHITSRFSDFLTEKLISIRHNIEDHSHDDAIKCKCDYECAKDQRRLIREIIDMYIECGGEVDENYYH